MDVDEDAATQETVGESHGGVKRKAGEDPVTAAKKLRMGMLTISFQTLVTDATIACRTCRHSFEEVNLTCATIDLSTSDRRL